MTREFSGHVRCDTACESCGTEYFYFTRITVREGVETPFEQKINEAAARAIDIVPCPECGKMSKAMWQDHWLALVLALIGLAVSLGGAFLLVMFAMESRFLFWGLGLIALGWAAVCAVVVVTWPFKPLFRRRSALCPGREHEANAKAWSKYQAWLRMREAEAGSLAE